MGLTYEKDYIMRMIKEMVRMLFALLFGRKQFSVEQELSNGHEVSGIKLEDLLAMADRGEINEAENRMLENIDYGSKDEVAAAALFYHFLSEKDDSFLQENNYSKEEVLDGIRRLMHSSGYGDVAGIAE